MFFQEKKPSVLRFNRMFALREFEVPSPGARAFGGWGDLGPPQEGWSRGRRERWCPQAERVCQGLRRGGALQGAEASQPSFLEGLSRPSCWGRQGPEPQGSGPRGSRTPQGDQQLSPSGVSLRVPPQVTLGTRISLKGIGELALQAGWAARPVPGAGERVRTGSPAWSAGAGSLAAGMRVGRGCVR